MNCDQAFEALTDINRQDCSRLIQHLDECPRCRDMAETLDPVLDLFGEVVEAGEGWEASSLTETNSENRVGEAAGSGSPEPRRAERPRSTISNRPWLEGTSRRTSMQRDGLRVSALLILIAAVMVGLANVGRNSHQAAVAISLPDNCQRTEVTESTADNVVAGCVACHLKAKSLASLQPIQQTRATLLVQQCVGCHLEMTTNQYLADLTADSSFRHNGQPATQLASCLFGRSDG